MLAMPCRRQASALVSAAADSFEADIAVMLDRLIAAGIGQVLVVDLSHHEIGIPVVRVIVPGLEGYMFDQYAPGLRAHAWLDRHL
jgi:ribosomal protein S12 methylthiotransferase accessory factor